MLSIKHSKEALAFWTLFKAMTPEIKKEVRDMVVYDETNDNEISIDSLAQTLLPGSEVRCNKIMTIRFGKNKSSVKIGEVTPQILSEILKIVKKFLIEDN